MNNKEKDNKEIKENVLNMAKLFLGNDFVEENIDDINNIIDDELAEYDKKYEQDKCLNDKCDKKEIVDTAVNTMKREQEKCECGEQKNKTPEYFTNRVTPKESLQIHKIVSEYVDSVVKPTYKESLDNVDYDTDDTDDVMESVYDTLYEFACWMLLK